MTAQNSKFSEDVSTTAGGTVLVAGPCVVWQIAASIESQANVVLNISDDLAGYTNAHRIDKVVFAGPDTEYINFPQGLNLTRGLCVTSNTASADVFVSYD